MRTRHYLAAAALLAVGLTNGAVAAAQGPPPQTPVQRGGRTGGRVVRPNAPGDAVPMNDVQQMLDAMVLGRAQPMLQLTDDQYPKFFKSMQALQTLRRRHQMQRQKLLGELRRMTDPRAQEPADDAAVEAQTKAFDDLETQMFQDEQKGLAAIDALLTPRQRARFRLFEENMEREKLRMLAKALAEPGKLPPPPPKKSQK